MPNHDPTDVSEFVGEAGTASIELMDAIMINQRAQTLTIIEQLELITVMARQPSTRDMVPEALQKLARDLRKQLSA